MVTVFVEDVNDNFPVFEDAGETLHVSINPYSSGTKLQVCIIIELSTTQRKLPEVVCIADLCSTFKLCQIHGN